LSDFITNGAAVLPDVKSDVRVPTGGVGEWASDDANQLRQALLDTRSEIINIVGAGSGAGSTTPIVANGSLTARTLGERFADVVNVKDFGAVGDGSTDDTAAIQAAITYCASFAPRWPKLQLCGRHKITAPLVVNRAIYSTVSEFVITASGPGNGLYSTSALAMFDTTAPLVLGVQPSSESISFEGVHFESSDRTLACYVLSERMFRVRFTDCTFYKARCIKSTTFVQSIHFDGCNIRSSGDVGATEIFMECVGLYDVSFDHCTMEYANTIVKSIGGGGVASFRCISSIIENIYSTPFILDGPFGVVFLGNYWEANIGHDIDLGEGGITGGSAVFIGNFFVNTNAPGPCIRHGACWSVVSQGNYATQTTIHYQADSVTNFVSIGDIVAAGSVSDATKATLMNDVAGQFGIGGIPQANQRVSIFGADTTAGHYAMSLYDIGGNAIARFSNDKKISFPALVNYADNATAQAGGLVAGDLYRTAGAVMVVT
jgi:hypothetical protein